MAGRKRKRQEELENKTEEPVAESGRIRVRICGREKGLEIYESVKFVRLISRGYNLLIMADYLPVIGELEGSMYFVADNEEHERTRLKGFFMHKNNEFSLMLEQEGDKGA